MEQINFNNIKKGDFSWPFWPVVPIYPYGRRRTICREVIPGNIWIFEQLIGIFYVVVPIRMTVVKLDQGGLFVYSPVAPTRECVRLVHNLVSQHGEIKYIILPTISGIEHKAFVGPFARRFPRAQVFVAPHQWSFPLNLPLSWLGFPPKRTQILPPDSSQTPLAPEFDYAILEPVELGPGRFSEVAFFHRRSQTLLITDTVISIPDEPPEITQLEPYPLLFHARDNGFEKIEDTKEKRRQGWHRICLFALYFRPSVLEAIEWGQVFKNALSAPDRAKKAYFGLFPFQWKYNWEESFFALRGGGRLFVAPILQNLILNRAPRETLDWADKISTWGLKRVIPCHFDAPVEITSAQFRGAFDFLSPSRNISPVYYLPDKDLEFIRQLDKNLSKRGITPPPKILP